MNSPLSDTLPDSRDDDVPDTDENSAILQFIAGTTEGKDFWAYVAMKPSLYAEYYNNVSNKVPMNVADYGEILEQGWGSKPPAEIEQKMATEYGASDDFEQNLQQELKEFIKDEAKKL